MFSYDKLWKLLIDRKMNKSDLQDAIQTTPKTIARMSKNENVSMVTLSRICDYFDCEIEDIIDHKKS
ncbi:helix-turn-helix domain-containing protein [Fundicoccus ignavus]|nr:helix-turn-helix transcriptional regulator [Fundicoccus ignavus]